MRVWREGGKAEEEAVCELCCCFLQLCHDGLAHQTPSCIQESPKKMRIPATHQLLGVGCDTRGVHAMFSARSLVRYLQFNLNTGKQSQDSPFSELISQYLLRQGPPMQLVPVNLSLLLLLDRDGGLYPLARDIGGGMKDLPLLVSSYSGVQLRGIRTELNWKVVFQWEGVCVCTSPKQTTACAVTELFHACSLQGLHGILGSLFSPSVNRNVGQRKQFRW